MNLAFVIYLGVSYFTAGKASTNTATMAGGNIKSLIGSIRRKPTTAPDQREDQEDEEKTGILHDLFHLGFKDRQTMLQAGFLRGTSS